MSRLDHLRERLHRRKANRERKHRLHQGNRARHEAKAVRTLRAQIRVLLDRRHRLPLVMFDDTNIDLIPRSARAVAGYVGGSWPTFWHLKAWWPRARRVSIAVNSGEHAQFLDIESGDATIEDAPHWWTTTPGARGFYISESMATALAAHLERSGIHRHKYVLWTAHYSGRHICGPKSCGCPVEADGTQWTSSSHERSLDESHLSPSFWDSLL